MGNRGFIRGKNDDGYGVYLHWNGGRDSVEAFLKYCKLRGFRGFGEDDGYAIARLVQIISNFFGGSLSIGVYPNTQEDMGDDNGSYIVEGWDIVDRKYPYKGFCEQGEYELEDFVRSIDESQPIKEQLGEVLDAKEVPTSSIQLGDKVSMQLFEDIPKMYEVIGFGEDEYVNGTNVKGLPFVDLFKKGYEHAKGNINCYVRDDKVLCIKKEEN